MRPVKITIKGRDFWVRTDQEDETVGEVVQYLNKTIERISEEYEHMPDDKILMLAALELAFELFEERKRRREEEERLFKILEKLEGYL